MLFNSFIFIFAFLPVTLGAYLVLARRYGANVVALWLSLASLFFYGWWNPRYLPLLIGSIAFNFFMGKRLSRGGGRRSGLLAFAVTINLLTLGIFKYSKFFLLTFATLSGIAIVPPNIILPLGISFFTFTQIAFLVDAHRGKVDEHHLVRYSLFVTYFPHLIAGPILHHSEMMPQFKRQSALAQTSENIAAGVTMFVLGLFKKVVVADSLSPFVAAIFASASSGAHLTFWEGWIGALAYTLQLYFDFSGYSEMALGLSRMFGIILPPNFNSPYRAKNIIEFWRRWHMTLSRFLRDYLYFSLGGNRKGPVRRYFNLMVTMLLGGLWHGAGWTFVVWGGLHGLYLCVNHGWLWFKKRLPAALRPFVIATEWLAPAITFVAVVVGWVFFRAQNFASAAEVLRAMFGFNGLRLPTQFSPALSRFPQLQLGPIWPNTLPQLNPNLVAIFVLLLLPVVWFLPNAIQLMWRSRPALELEEFPQPSVYWKRSAVWAVVIGFLAACALIRMLLSAPTEFLYFQF
jgi:D-alanyl-lipoteichoic acid acyltransferase DltB (MBOAT superfamily)